MFTRHISSLGGIQSGIRNRRLALEKYYANPSICKQCSSVIQVQNGRKVAETKIKSFCNHKCAAVFNNQRRNRTKKLKPSRQLRVNTLPLTSKGSLFSKRKNYQSARSAIRKHAGNIIALSGRAEQCEKCGYDKHVEVAHIKSVADHPGSALIGDINHPDNLMYLCPNCHWEYDNR